MSLAQTEYCTLTLPSSLSRNAIRQLLVEEAEKNHWTLDRVQVLPSGKRIIRLRRKIMRVSRTQVKQVG
ncbi:hypothetical protein GALL_365160 [mine drainage metagenome]|uniref:Uncharacterized protein n=1 Tax=mine drainage metagenome TaxID=410659 RepID=A0A1J5QE17_9ZZZZ